MKSFELEALRRPTSHRREPYVEFLRVDSMSAGLYSLRAGSEDPQGPHGEDEVYHILEGRARIRVGDDDRAVRPGFIVFVPAGVRHGFHDIREDLTTLVFFAPAEGAAARSDPRGQEPDRAST